MSFTYLPAAEIQPGDVLVPLQVLKQSADYAEVWTDGEPVNCSENLHQQLLKTTAHLVYIEYSNEADIAQVVTQAYQNAFEYSAKHGFDHLLRTWNYIDDINGSDAELERYQSFCVARHDVLEQFNQLNRPNPAATAIGSHNGQHCFVFLFGHQPARVIENNRQVPAWRYPKQYAPKQPRFSRAIILEGMLLCSGTASVVGHETIHLNDVSSQFDECMKNIAVLLAEDGNRFEVGTGCYRFYLRDTADLNVVEEKMKGAGIKNFVVLHGDICRENLLLECEVVFQ